MTKQYLIGASMALALGVAASALAEGTGRQGEEQSQQGQQQRETGSESAAQEPAESEAAEEAQSGQAQEQASAEADEFANLSKEQKKQLQRELQNRGHYQGNIDGIIGPMTRAALENFQQQQGITSEGGLNEQTASALGLDLEQQPVAGTESPERQPMAGQEGLEPGAQGMQISSLDQNQLRQLQTKLQELGHYRGEIDGVAGPMTRSALEQYFRAQAQLAARGMLNESTLSALGVQWGGAQPGTAAPAPTEQPQQAPQPAPQQAPTEQPQQAPQQTTPY